VVIDQPSEKRRPKAGGGRHTPKGILEFPRTFVKLAHKEKKTPGKSDVRSKVGLRVRSGRINRDVLRARKADSTTCPRHEKYSNQKEKGP